MIGTSDKSWDPGPECSCMLACLDRYCPHSSRLLALLYPILRASLGGLTPAPASSLFHHCSAKPEEPVKPDFSSFTGFPVKAGAFQLRATVPHSAAAL